MRFRRLIIGDNHVLSNYAVMPLNFTLTSGQQIRPAKGFQEWVSHKWMDFCHLTGVPSQIIYMGDLTEGFCEKTAGVGIWSADKDDALNAFKLLHLILTHGKDIETYVVQGTGYHSGSQRGINLDKECANEINADYRMVLPLEKDGRLDQFAHQSGGVSLKNADTGIKNEIDFAENNSGKYGYPLPNNIWRGHIHRYALRGDDKVTAIQVPCWEGTTPYMARKTSFIVPSIGGIVQDFNEKKLEPSIRKIIFDIPQDIAIGFNEVELLRIEKNRFEAESIKGIERELRTPTLRLETITANKREEGKCLTSKSIQSNRKTIGKHLPPS